MIEKISEKKNYSHFLDQIEGFDSKINDFLTELAMLGISTNSFTIDHIALRIKASDIVMQLEEEILSNGGRILEKSVVNGRPIAIIQLPEPVKISEQEIFVLELPYPATPHDYTEDSWEHVEIVIGGNASNNDELKMRFQEIFPNAKLDEIQSSGIKIKESQAIAENDQLPNPTITFEKYKGLAVKFHCKSLQEVIGK